MKTTKIKTVMAFIIKRLPPEIPSHYVADILDHISHGLLDMEVQGYILDRKSVKLNIVNYCAKLPCDLRVLDAVYHNETRLPLGGDVRDLPNLKDQGVTENYYSNPVFAPARFPRDIYDNPIEPVDIKRFDETEYYYINGDVIITSFECGEIHLSYKGLELDEDNYPLIPDSASLREALYWYVLKNIILSGYKHSAIDFVTAETLYTKQYKPIAISDLIEWTPERANKLINATVRNKLIQDPYSYERSFINSERPYD